MEQLRCENLVIGAGLVGLAVARRIGSSSTILVEAHDGFGQETSSRNSEVIHSGIHYPADSWKTRLCIDGRALLISFLEKHRITFRECGKLVVAQDEAEEAYLDRLAEHSSRLSVPCEKWSEQQIAASEPLVKAKSALHFPRSGIVDSHQLMAALEQQAVAKQVTVAYLHRAEDVVRAGSGWSVRLHTPDGPLEIECARVINAAGLGAAALSNQALETNRYEHRFCRGRYFQLSGRYTGAFKKLIYPVPQKDGLGVHVTIDTAGQARLGPDTDWLPAGPLTASAFQCDWEGLAPVFKASADRILKDLHAEDMAPGLIGIRPKLFVDGQAHPDFLIEEHDGWVHCLGIESPGLTSVLAIGERVASLLEIE